MKRADFEILLDENGQGIVLINGEDWSGRVCGVELTAQVDKFPVLTLSIVPTSLTVLGQAEMEAPALCVGSGEG